MARLDIAPATVSVIQAAYNVSGRNWGWELYGEGFTQDYRADVGFFQRTNSNFNSASCRYNSDPNPKKKIISYHLHTFNHVDYDWQGRMYTWESENLVELQLPRNSWVGVWWEPGYERLFDHEFGPTREAKAVRSAGFDLVTSEQARPVYVLRREQRALVKQAAFVVLCRLKLQQEDSVQRSGDSALGSL